MTETMLTYHGKVGEKRATLKQLRHHRELDQIIQGTYWSGNGEGRGCAVGCLTHDPNGGHDQFPDTWGIPVQVAYLIDHIFESLPVEEAKDWPVRIMSAVPVGADLARVYDRWAYWMLSRLVAKAPEGTPMAEVEVMASLFERAGAGDEPSVADWSGASEAARAARASEATWAARATWAAWAARAARAARAAEAARAARAAEASEAARAARAAEAAWAARATRASEATWAARATRAARAARARHDWARAAADELVRLVKAAA